ncbi:MAG: UDP-N-acetylenolpyruvoylglucosamine reductase [Candidatus Tagabacteria bacterium RIFCSPLOWO2_01_FULL_39_11]|uniref:UDP-N-acetylenolpyruvoylglucosamine reductase n=1 Tax=Candidatus Tagabacteria bacterium RIFCSPLOWO2_01_FULL_39_11 TaxID=1802295 RepID=A0A1G2LQM5_9BACT|nr:MAG: UDP-N-acetylenolpyruvoylglucosamine reductase [Candidatus Tagabacteria bacterium RIFCSPLOWO2_01_FULL_39_11]
MNLNIQENVILAPFTTFKIGGPARFFSVSSSEDELIGLIKWAKEKKLPVFALGGGSNILVSDKGFDGLVIKIQNPKYEIKNLNIFTEAGVPFAKLIFESAKSELTGLEWGAGIPGTIGGATNGNAGAFGEDISASIEKARVFDVKDFSVKEFNNKMCGFQYRDSVFKKNPDLIILSLVLKLQKGNAGEINESIKDALKQRNESHGAGVKSAGCVFKNIPWGRKDIDKDYLTGALPDLKKYGHFPRFSAGFIIDSLGLRGKKLGDAMVLEKHANFIVNLEKAKAEHIIMLIGLIKERVDHKYGIKLEEEIQLVGFD